MNREANKLLDEAYERELAKLRTMTSGDEGYSDTIDMIAKLRKMMQEERQSNTECLTKIAACVGSIGVGVAYLLTQKRMAYDVLKFEETGTIASTVGRNVIGNWLKFKQKI